MMQELITNSKQLRSFCKTNLFSVNHFIEPEGLLLCLQQPAVVLSKDKVSRYLF